jgi:hypothetical protein
LHSHRLCLYAEGLVHTVRVHVLWPDVTQSYLSASLHPILECRYAVS